MIIQGAGGKSGGGAKEGPNTVRSEAVAKILDLICAGQIYGFVTPSDPLKSIYYDGLPVQNADGSFNNYGVQVEYTLGTMDQDPIKGFDSVDNTTPVNIQATIAVKPSVTITNTLVDSVLATCTIPALTQANSKTGALEGTWCSFQWEIKGADEGTWTVAYADYISEKFTTSTSFDYIIDISAKVYPVSIRLVRITADSGSVSVQNDLYFSAYTQIINEKLSYPGSALIAHTVQAKQFGSSIPSRGAHIYGQLCLIPSNYNPWTRVYTGVWNGTFVQGWTNNPAWVLLSCLVNTDWGLGEYISINDIDKVALYTIAQYCDAPVDNGLGGTEARYSFNAYIQTQESAAAVIQAISSSFQGMTFAATSKVLFAQDSPSDPVALVTNANVIGGAFQYEGIGVGTRKSAYMVEWNNPDKNYELDYEFCEDPELIAKYGYKMERLPLLGCTSRGQARRAGRWRLFTNKYQDRMIAYKASLDHGFILPGALIRVADARQQTYRYGGRIVSSTNTTATLDAPTTLVAGKTYQLHYVDPAGNIQTRTITTGVGETSTVTVSATMAGVLPANGTVWIITSGEEVPYRVMGVREVGGRQPFVEIVAAKHYNEKYALIEGTASIEVTRPYSVDSKVPILPPTNAVISKKIRNTSGMTEEYLNISFTPSVSKRAQYYNVSYRHNYGEWKTVTTYTDAVQLPWSGSGRYQTSIVALGIGDQQDQQSIPLEYELNIADARPIAKPTITGLALAAGSISPTVFGGGTAKFTWSVAVPSTFTNSFWEDPYFRDFEIEMRTTGNVLIATYYTRSPFFEFTSERNAETNAGVPRRAFKMRVRIRDTFASEVVGDYVELSVSNPAPATPSGVVVTAIASGLRVTMAPPTDLDWKGTLLWTSQTPGITLPGTPVDLGKTTTFTLTGTIGSPLYYRFAFYDEFGKDTLNATTESNTSIPTVVGTIGSGSIADGAVTNPKIATDAVQSGNIQNGAVVNLKIATDAIQSAQVQAGAIIAGKLGALAVATADIQNAAIATAKLATGAVTSNELGDSSVINTKIATNAVQSAQINAGAVIAGKLGALAVATADIQNAAIATAKLATGAVTSNELGAGSVINAKLGALAVDTAKLADAAVSGLKIAASAITADKIAANTITASRLVLTDTSNIVKDAEFNEVFGVTLPWRIASGNVTRVTSGDALVTALGQAIVAKVIGNGPGTTNRYDYIDGATVSGRVPIEPLKPFYASADIAVTAGFNGAAYFDIAWVNSSDADFAYSQVGVTQNYLSSPAGSTIVATVSGRVTAPAGAVKMHARLIVDWDSNFAARNKAGTCGFARPVIRRAVNADLIVDGSITAAKIAADTITAAQIEAGAIGASELAANAVIAGKIQAGTIVAADIAANTITGAKIAANTITASKLVVMGDSLVTDPHFTDLPSWYTYNETSNLGQTLLQGAVTNGGWYSDGSAPAIISTQYAAAIWSGLSGPNYLNPHVLVINTPIPVMPSEFYEFGARVAHNANHAASISVNWLTAAGGYISTSSVAMTTGAGLHTIRTQAQAPSNAGLASIVCYKNANASAYSGAIVVTGLFLRQCGTGTLIVDGSLAATKIIADSITATQIQAGAIGASELAANSVIAGKIQAGTIVAADIAAGTITSDKILAGTIASDRLMTGGRSNLLYGSDGWGSDLSSWFVSGWNPDGKSFTGPSYQLTGDNTWNYLGEPRGTIGIRQNDGTAGGVGLSDWYFVRRTTTGTQNQWYNAREGLAYTFALTHAAHRCRHNLFMGFYNSAFTYITEIGLPTGMIQPGSGGEAGVEGGSWTRSFISGIAPAGTKYILLALRREHTTQGFGYTDSYSWITRAGLWETNSVMTSAPAWGPPGLTLIQGGNIVTDSITASQIAANTITAAEIAANTITADKMNVATLSAITANMGTLTAGTIDVSGGLTIQSASSGTRIVITNSRLEVYSGATLRVRLGIW